MMRKGGETTTDPGGMVQARVASDVALPDPPHAHEQGLRRSEGEVRILLCLFGHRDLAVGRMECAPYE